MVYKLNGHDMSTILNLCIFRSESTSQAFLLTVSLIFNELKHLSPEDQAARLLKYTLCYDNMCNLDKLRAAKEPLPLPAPMDKMWSIIKKTVDRLHLRNHKNPMCKELYNPDKLLPAGYNTMAGEQTFAWMSRFKKIVNSMTQTHHLFYLHRMCLRRNRYTAICRKRGKCPVLPGINYNIASPQ